MAARGSANLRVNKLAAKTHCNFVARLAEPSPQRHGAIFWVSFMDQWKIRRFAPVLFVPCSIKRA